MKKYKIKDLPKDFSLVDCKLNGQFIISGWNKGFWVKDDLKSSQMFPVFFESFKEIENWEIEVPEGRALEIEVANL